MQKVFLWILIVIVAIAPLPLGSNRPLGWSLLALAVGGLLTGWSLHRIWTGHPLAIPVRRVRTPLILFAVTCAWVLIQLIPNIPFGLAHPGWREVSIFFGTDVPGRITIDPDWTKTVLMRWLAYAAVFWLALQLCQERAAANTALRAFVVISSAYALYGLVALLAANDTILIYDKWAGRGELSSTFVNRNSYATFAGLGLVATTAMIIAAGMRPRSRNSSLKARALRVLSSSVTRKVYLYLGFLLLTTALVLSGSRAGVFSTASALALLGWLMARGRKLGGWSLAGRAGLIFVIGGGVLAFSGGLLGDRLTYSGDSERQEVYQQTITAIEDHALLGSGLGSFPQIFQLYRTSDNLRRGYVEKAHNSYLENMLELGLPASACLFLALLGLARLCWQGMAERARDHHFAAMGLAASTVVGLHSLVDFSLQIPAVTVAYMFLMGIAVAQSFSSRQR